jgi:hypothetical protein
MTTILATVIFLLADGTPAKTAIVSCLGVPVYHAGSDEVLSLDEGSPLLIDSRGAFIVEVMPNTTLTCTAKAHGQTWAGDLTFTKTTKKTRRIVLKGLLP